MSHEPRGRAQGRSRPASHPLWRDSVVTTAGTTREPSFVGRVPEINRAMRMLGAARQRDGQVAVIAGPAGIGKTRLAEEIVGRARRRRARVAVGQCSHDGEMPPLWPWATILRQLGAREDLLLERTGEPAGGRFARFLAVLEFLRASSPQAPFVIVVDDVHLADLATLLLARFLARERRGLPLLLLLTRREPAPERDRDVRELLAELDRHAVALALPALTQEGVARYLSACGVAPPGPELLEVVTAVTGGNPLHLRSLVLQSGLAASGLRGGLEHAVARQLEQVSADDRRLVGLAAVLGPEVSVHEVARVADTSPALAAETLARACRLALMVEREGDRLAFIHDLVREAASSSLAVSDRLDAHARAALLLGGREPERLLRRAHHAFAAASRSRKDAALAVATAREAARALLGADGFESAAALLARAVDDPGGGRADRAGRGAGHGEGGGRPGLRPPGRGASLVPPGRAHRRGREGSVGAGAGRAGLERRLAGRASRRGRHGAGAGLAAARAFGRCPRTPACCARGWPSAWRRRRPTGAGRWGRCATRSRPCGRWATRRRWPRPSRCTTTS